MEDRLEVTGHIDELRYIVVINLKVLQFEQVFNIAQVACNQVVHTNHIIAFFYKTVAQVRSEKSGGPCDEYSFS